MKRSFIKALSKLCLILLIVIAVLAGCSVPDKKTGGGSSAEESEIKDSPKTDIEASLPESRSAEPLLEDKKAGAVFKDIYMADKLVGWAISDSALYHTTDGGADWTDITPKSAALSQGGGYLSSKFACIDKNTGFLVVPQWDKSVVEVYKTTDGGRRWSISKASDTYDKSPYVNSIYFTDAQYGWMLLSYGAAAGSEPAEVYRTVDGGATWKKAAGVKMGGGEGDAGVPFGGHKTGIVFRNTKNGFISGFDFGNELFLHASYDGGIHWVRQPLQNAKGYTAEAGSAETLSPIFFSSKEGLLPVGYHDKEQTTFFYSTNDGGKTWQIPSNPLKSDGENGFIWSFPDRAHGFATDGSGMYVTDDGAKTWNKVYVKNTNFKNISVIDFINEKDGWAIGNSLLLKTEDGGRTWTALNKK